MTMAIGSIENTAFVFTTIYGNRAPADARQRLLLMLLADACSAGLGLIDLSAFAEFTAAPDAAAVHDDLKALSRAGLVKVSANHSGEAAVALAIATDDEIKQARVALGCRLPFLDWTGAT